MHAPPNSHDAVKWVLLSSHNHERRMCLKEINQPIKILMMMMMIVMVTIVVTPHSSH